jgi:hypothetical protein
MTAGLHAQIFRKWRQAGWIPEPDAMDILRAEGLEVVPHRTAGSVEEAVRFAGEIGFPVVAKVVSPEIMHKSDVAGVATGITTGEELAGHFERFRRMEGFTGMLVAAMLSGVELILGARIDSQFGPAILLGIGGTGVEIYGDVAVRLAPLSARDAAAMAAGLRGRPLLEGFRRQPGVNMENLTATMLRFSDLVMKYRDRIESVDINPLICSVEKCTVADARIVLPGRE